MLFQSSAESAHKRACLHAAFASCSRRMWRKKLFLQLYPPPAQRFHLPGGSQSAWMNAVSARFNISYRQTFWLILFIAAGVKLMPLLRNSSVASRIFTAWSLIPQSADHVQQFRRLPRSWSLKRTARQLHQIGAQLILIGSAVCSSSRILSHAYLRACAVRACIPSTGCSKAHVHK